CGCAAGAAGCGFAVLGAGAGAGFAVAGGCACPAAAAADCAGGACAKLGAADSTRLSARATANTFIPMSPFESPLILSSKIGFPMFRLISVSAIILACAAAGCGDDAPPVTPAETPVS